MSIARRNQVPLAFGVVIALIFILTFFQFPQTQTTPASVPTVPVTQPSTAPKTLDTEKVPEHPKTLDTEKVPERPKALDSERVPERPKPFIRKHFDDKTFDYKKIEYLNRRVEQITDGDDTVLIISTIGNGESYGQNRKFLDLFETIKSFDYKRNLISMSFLVGEEQEFHNIDAFFLSYFGELMNPDPDFENFINKVTITIAPFIERDFTDKDRGNRHLDHIQRLRRRQIARSRNFNLFNSLKNEKYTLFIDADITIINTGNMLNAFIASQGDIVVPRIQSGGLDDYDKNSWRGRRTKPNDEQLAKMDRNEWDSWDYVPNDIESEMYHFQNHVDDVRNMPDTDPMRAESFIVDLDSVGGAILFAKSVIYKQGVVFPPNYIVGTSWDRLEGYDGIETEGLCYTAKVLGYKCRGMPNLLAQHDPHLS